MSQFFLYTLTPIFITGILLALILTPLCRRLARRYNWLDEPSSRKVHDKAVPLLGGLALYLSFMAIVFAHLPLSSNLMAIFFGGTCILVLGLIDDRYKISASLKLMGQIFVAVLTVYFGFWV